MSRIRYIAPQFTKESKEAVGELYPTLQTGLRGGGLTPELDARTLSRMKTALSTEFKETRSDLESNINRYIPLSDIKVRQYLRNALKQQYAVAGEGIGREFEFRGFEDLPVAQEFAFNALGGEKGVASQAANMATQSSLRRAASPTFSSELMGGLGGALGTYLALGQPKTNTFSAQNVRFGESLDPGFIGSSYMSNFSGADFAKRFSSMNNFWPG